MARAAAAILALTACLVLPGGAGATSARMSAAFTPEHLGAPTTVSFGFHISGHTGTPPALTSVELAYPHNLGLATSGLGLAACVPAELELLGPSGCPANSQMGYGSAVVEIEFGPELVEENVELSLFAAPSPDGYIHVLAYARGRVPVQAFLVLSAVLLPGHIAITVPPIASLPEAPYVSVARMNLTLGGHLTYFETVKGRLKAYRPPGVGLPSVCPRGGFRFGAVFGLLDGEHVRSRAAVACPPRR